MTPTPKPSWQERIKRYEIATRIRDNKLEITMDEHEFGGFITASSYFMAMSDMQAQVEPLLEALESIVGSNEFSSTVDSETASAALAAYKKNMEG